MSIFDRTKKEKEEKTSEKAKTEEKKEDVKMDDNPKSPEVEKAKDEIKQSVLEDTKKKTQEEIDLFKLELEDRIKTVDESIAKMLKEASEKAEQMTADAKGKCDTALSANENVIEKRNQEIAVKEAVVEANLSRIKKADTKDGLDALILDAQKTYNYYQHEIKNIEKEKELIIKTATENAEKIASSSIESYASQLKAESDKIQSSFKVKLADERAVFDNEIKQREDEIAKRKAELDSKQKELAGDEEAIKNAAYYKGLFENAKKDYDDLMASFEHDRQSKRDEITSELEKLKADNQKIVENNVSLQGKESELARQESDLAVQKTANDRKEEALKQKEKDLDSLIAKEVAEIAKSKDQEIEQWKSRYEDKDRERTLILNKFATANTLLKERSIDPDAVSNASKLKDDKIKELRKQIDDIKAQNDQENIECKSKADKYDSLLKEFIDERNENEALKRQAETQVAYAEDASRSESQSKLWKAQYLALADELNKSRTPTKEQRLVSLRRKPQSVLDFGKLEDCQINDEIEWLDRIKDDSEKSGIYFSKRMIYAYHTAMKIHDWSPLTVLAGVSGTGKSELPRQYAIHGGMYFVSIAVKPDWDSPSSLFGYYNSIENMYEPTELSQILYHAQTMSKDTLSQKMVMVLLDEMNLAHIELYFADLLSKYEFVRGTNEDVKYEIDLGAQCDPEILTIGKNILWTGTMNEDETTKGLSDKVVDRSTLITFPRPDKLRDRKSVENVKESFSLSVDQWKIWVDGALDYDDVAKADDKLMEKYKTIVETINSSMSEMGKNLGHRVWQSIANYMLNHPGVINSYKQGKKTQSFDKFKVEMQRAFADAVAFKIMPKLRGVEVKGGYEVYLSAIKGVIDQSVNELSVDFGKALNIPTGLFQWRSAEFLDDKEADRTGVAKSKKEKE